MTTKLTTDSRAIITELIDAGIADPDLDGARQTFAAVRESLRRFEAQGEDVTELRAELDAAQLDADERADEAELAALQMQREEHTARLAAADAERIGPDDDRLACDVVGCIAAAAGRWDITARPTSYRAVPLCRAHVAEHRAAPQVRAVRPSAAS